MTEDDFEEFLKKTAQSYNAPPVRVPREEMWESIQAKRSAGPRLIYGGGSAMRVSSERRFGSRVWMGVAAAAVLLLATGVGIGRWSATSDNRPSVAATRAATAVPGSTAGNSGAGEERSTPGGNIATNEPGTGRQPNASSSGVGPDREATANDFRGGGNARIATTRPSSRNPSSGTAGPSAYQLATVSHLSEAEALLTSFRTRSSADQQMDAQLGSWAREVLTNTRLLLDSPVANDPQRRPLLEDLELVLVQIVQLSPGSAPQDRELIEKTLQHDHVMTRLRTAIPAGAQRGS